METPQLRRTQNLDFKDVVQVEALGDGTYGSTPSWQFALSFLKGAYGGQLVAQATMSAIESLNIPNCWLYSVHCYFISPATLGRQILYHVHRIKEGRTFSHYFVKGVQGGAVVVACLLSFQKQDSGPRCGMVNQTELVRMPDVPHPSDPSAKGLYVRDMIVMDLSHSALEVLLWTPGDWAERVRRQQQLDPMVLMWIKCTGSLSGKDPENLHRAALAYASDLWIALLPLLKYPHMKMELLASVDHSVWFHGEVRMDQWNLVVMCWEWGAGGLGLHCSHFFSEDGSLVATCKQLEVIRAKL